MKSLYDKEKDEKIIGSIFLAAIITIIITTITTGFTVLSKYANETVQADDTGGTIYQDRFNKSLETDNWAPPESPKFVIGPNITWLCDKGNLKLYLDVVQIDNTSIYVYGEAYHLDRLMEDMRVNKSIIRGDGVNFSTASNDIMLTFENDTIIVYDHRDDTMKFDGTFTMVEPIDDTTVEEVSEDDKVENIILDEESISGKDLITWMLDENNLRKEISIKAKYQGSYPAYNGMVFTTMDDSQIFYVFGAKWNREDPVVTMNLVYRGFNKRYNGLTFEDGYQYCFNLDKFVD